MAFKYQTVSGGACAARGFQSHAVSCGIKNPDADRLDLTLIASDSPCVAAGVFTRNRVTAAPVKVSRAYVRNPRRGPRAILANSGNANACTGVPGLKNARELARLAARELGVLQSQVLVASTGIIGVPLPMNRIVPRVPELVKGLTPGDSDDAAQAIMTSDTRPKQVAIEIKIGGAKVRIGGIAKGAGMIRPDMATMLAFITTDADISAEALDRATRDAVDESFNCITIDGDMSTNDTVFVLANGCADNRPINEEGEDARLFREGLRYVMLELARKIVRDGERVTKFVEVAVSGALSDLDAKKVAEAVANSNLVKSSWNGNDPNWGRIIHAVGHSGARIDENRVDIFINGMCACRAGMASDTPLEQLVLAVEQPEFCIHIELNRGSGQHRVYASDLSPEYVDYNRKEYAILKNTRAQKDTPSS